jgi:hypothetical protein
MRKHLFSLVAMATALLCAHHLGAQNTSPYWSLAGNSNATSSSKLGTTNAIPLRLFTSNLPRIYITPGGNVGVGTTAPAQKLHVAGNAYITGSVGIGTNTLTYKLNVAGKASISSGLIVGSGAIYGYGGTTNSLGVYGSGSTYGLYGNSPGYGVYANSTAGGTGVYGNSSYVGIWGKGSYGVYGQGTYGTYGSGSSYGAVGAGGTYGVYGSGSYGVYGSGTAYGVYGSGGSIGVYGTGPTYAIYGFSTSGRGVYGYSSNGIGGYFYSANYYGLWAETGRADNYYAAVFNGNVYCYNSYLGSDKNLKQNIEEFDGALDIINKLKPRNYEFRHDGKFATMNLPTGKHYGLIAQELEEVLPNLVKESPFPVSKLNVDDQLNVKDQPADPTQTNGNIPKEPTVQQELKSPETINIKAVNYTELIPILVKGMQELSQENKDLRQEVSELKLLMTKLTLGQGGTGSLLQNVPNPVKNATNITYSLPEGTNGAQLLITDALGRTIRQMTLSTSGVINLDVSTFASGVYNYSLVVNNKILDTRKMTVLR